MLLDHSVASPQQWLKARRALLDEEKEESRRRDEFHKRQRALPWVKIDKPYVFTTPDGDISLTAHSLGSTHQGRSLSPSAFD